MDTLIELESAKNLSSNLNPTKSYIHPTTELRVSLMYLMFSKYLFSRLERSSAMKALPTGYLTQYAGGSLVVAMVGTKW